jgi:conserved repeat domain
MFSPGLQSSVFDLTFPSANTRTWTLQGSSVTASTASVFCPADLEVIQSVDNNTPSGGDTVTFTITLNNLTSNVPATAVELSYYLDFHFVFISAAASSGTYNPTTQRRLIPEVLNGSPQTLTIKAQVLEPAPM